MNLREIVIALRNMVVGGNLESWFDLLVMPQSAVSYATECRFLHGCMFQNDRIPVKNVWDSFRTEQVRVVLYSPAAQEWFRSVASYTADLVSMCMLCQILKPKVIFEIGTYRGAGALHWAGNAPDAEVYTLDLPPDSSPSLGITTVDELHIVERGTNGNLAFSGKPEMARIHQLLGDSATFDFSPFFGKVDLFFIDGAHSYAYVRSDTSRALECIKPGSVIAWHDYGRFGFNGVSKLLHELSNSGMEIYRVPGGSLAYTLVNVQPSS